ncbi:MAG: ParB N-terminal domain-containing protein [Actinophytocola sp.]|uniref:ParB/RepB/Spo0J family partition protein n=1 Tax=Actinophytocola sp. TaxID=1872138 RepID=UPI003C7086D8
MTTTLTPSRWFNTRFELMDPRKILLDKNARTIEDIKRENPDLVDSVGKHGVLQPAIVHPTTDGGVRMHDGHQRALALIEHIGLDVDEDADEALVMPVIITDLTDESDHAWLREMWIFNEQRKGFSAIEKVEILEQMALDGLGDEEIATQLSIPTEMVRAGRRVHANAMARSALTENRQLSFEQADAFAEFADDTDACDRLNATLNEDPDTFDHTVSELQQERATRIARDELIEKLRADNVHILEDHEVASSQRLTDLFQDQERKNRLSNDIDAHKACSGHAARVVQGYFDSEPHIQYWCRHWEIRGHVRSAASSSSYGSGARKGKRSAVEKAEHNRVVRNNKRWLAAIPVRRKKLAELLAADELPARVQHHVALATYDGAIEHTPKSKALAYEFLGFTTKRGKQVKLATKLRRATADRATMVNLAFLLAAFEVTYDLAYAKNTWRRPTDNDRIYFQLLDDLWGTKLPKNVAEQLVLEPDADKKDWPHLQAAAAPAAPEPDAAADTENDSQDDFLASSATDAVHDEDESFAEDVDDAELTGAELADDSVAV